MGRCGIVLQHVLVHGLLCTEAGGSLLEVLGTGVETIDKMILWEGYVQLLMLCLPKCVYLCAPTKLLHSCIPIHMRFHSSQVDRMSCCGFGAANKAGFLGVKQASSQERRGSLN